MKKLKHTGIKTASSRFHLGKKCRFRRSIHLKLSRGYFNCAFIGYIKERQLATLNGSSISEIFILLIQQPSLIWQKQSTLEQRKYNHLCN